jgi:tryptophan-specific transport protein
MNHLGTNKPVSLIHGATVIFSTAVGVGMMSIPIVSVGMWFTLSTLVLIITALYLIFAGGLLLEVNMHFPHNTGIHTMVDKILGKRHAAFNAAFMLFNGYILIYAYITVGGEAIQFYIKQITNIELHPTLGGLFFASIFGIILFLESITISRILSVFITLMILSFGYVSLWLVTHVELDRLIDTYQSQFTLFPYVLIALPFFVAAFGYQQTVPMLRSLYNSDAKRVFQAIKLGVFAVGLLYFSWLVLTMGNNSQANMIIELSQGDKRIENLISALSSNDELKAIMFSFLQLAVVTSFVGVAKGVLDYLMDFFVNNLGLSSTYPKLLVITPPLILSLLFPYGFLLGIGFAGLTGAIWGGVYPALMALKIKYKTLNSTEELRSCENTKFLVPGGIITPWFVLFYSLVIIAAITLSLFEFLPKYPVIKD